MSVVAKLLDGSRCHLIGRYRPRPRPHCVRWGPSSQLTASPKTGDTSRSHFSAHVLWPNGCMDQDATWYGGRPQPWPHCVRWGPSSQLTPSPLKNSRGTSRPHFSAHVLWPNGWMDQDVTWQEGSCLGPGDIVLDGEPAPLKRGTTSRPTL